MAIECKHCGGKVRPKASKIAVALGGSVAMAPLAAAVGLKAGLIALAVAAFHGNRDASRLLKLKMQLMSASQKMGSFFYCKNCERDASVADVFNQIL